LAWLWLQGWAVPSLPAAIGAGVVRVLIVGAAQTGLARSTSGPRETSEAKPADVMKRAAHRLGVAQTMVLAAVIFLSVRAVAQNFRVEGSSMEPGLHDGQYLLVNKAVYLKINLETLSKYIPFIDPGDRPQRFLFRAPHRGDVIVFRFPRDPARDFIKRVIGVPGDTIKVVDGQVSVNGVALRESYIENPGRYDYPEQAVPVFVPSSATTVITTSTPVWAFCRRGSLAARAIAAST
jgi:signal peptidase I